MTLDPAEAREALRETELRSGDGLGNQLLAVLLGGLSFVPLFLGTVAAIRHDGRLWLVLAGALAVALLGSTVMVSRRMRDRSRTFGQVYTGSIVTNALVYLALLLLAVWHQPSWSTAGVRTCFLLVVPLVAAGVVAAVQRRR